MMRKKYDTVPEPEPGPLFSKSDTKELRRLVRKYGRQVIVEAARTIPKQSAIRPGRPERGKYTYLERMHLADWIEEQAEKHRRDDVRNYLDKAIYDLFLLQYEGEEDAPDLDKFMLTTRRKYFRGRRELKLVIEAAEAQRRSLRNKRGRV